MKKIYILLTILFCAAFVHYGFSQTRIDKISTLEDESSALIQASTLGIEVSTYPNPASKSLTFSIQGIEFVNVQIEIFELTGQPVITLHPDKMLYMIDVSSYKEGIYFYKVICSGEVLKSEKFIVLKK